MCGFGMAIWGRVCRPNPHIFYYFKFCTVENKIDFCNDVTICQNRNDKLDSKFINSTLINNGDVFFANLKNDEYFIVKDALKNWLLNNTKEETNNETKPTKTTNQRRG